ncbi:MAG: hypothetical protein QOF32_2345 [Gammaproteobacteria bacterium]|nr:hypothetical protein [Gammaproteobacteria bacterium]
MNRPTMQFSGCVDFAASRLGQIRRPVEHAVEFHSGAPVCQAGLTDRQQDQAISVLNQALS